MNNKDKTKSIAYISREIIDIAIAEFLVTGGVIEKITEIARDITELKYIDNENYADDFLIA